MTERKQEDAKSNEDSGVETMEVDDKTDSETPVIERKEAEKRKRTSSSANYEVTDEQVLGTLQTIFAVKLPKAATSAPDSNLNLPDTAAFLALKTAENEESCPQDIDWKELINEMTSYLMQCYARSHQEEKDQKKRATVPPLSDA